MLPIIRYVSLLVCLCGFMAACGVAPAGQGSGEISAVVLQTGRQCLPAPEGWRATWIVSSEDLGEITAKCRSNFIPVTPEPVPEVDFTRFGVLAVEMGEKPSAGYGFSRYGVTARLDGRVLAISLTYNSPASDALTAQVITNPWILIRLPLGSYDALRVVDPEGGALVQIDDITSVPDE